MNTIRAICVLMLCVMACRRAETPINATTATTPAHREDAGIETRTATTNAAQSKASSDTNAPVNTTRGPDALDGAQPTMRATTKQPAMRLTTDAVPRRLAAAATQRVTTAATAATTPPTAPTATPVVGTPIRRADLIAARGAVNAYRRSVGLADVVFTDPVPVKIRAVHFNELRDALASARTASGLTTTFTEPIAAGRPVRAQHLTEIIDRAVVTAPQPSTAPTCIPISTVCTSVSPCAPPPACRFIESPPPFDAPVRYDGELQMAGARYWRWVKIGEPSRPCTDSQRQEAGEYGRGCAARVGDALLLTPPFRMAR